MFLGRLMRSAMVLISLKALSMARSELLIVRLFWYFEFPNSSKLAAPVPCGRVAEKLLHFMWNQSNCSSRIRLSSAIRLMPQLITVSVRRQSYSPCKGTSEHLWRFSVNQVTVVSGAWKGGDWTSLGLYKMFLLLSQRLQSQVF